jgi:hypothetical protein
MNTTFKHQCETFEHEGLTDGQNQQDLARSASYAEERVG